MREEKHSLVMVLGKGLPGREIGSLRESRHCEGIRSKYELCLVFAVVSVSVTMIESERSCPSPNESKAKLRESCRRDESNIPRGRETRSNGVGYGVRRDGYLVSEQWEKEVGVMGERDGEQVREAVRR